MTTFISSATDDHERTEELQWANMMKRDSQGAISMVIVMIQKLCTSFHEIGPAILADHLSEESTPYYTQSLNARMQKLIDVIDDNGFSSIEGYAIMQALQKQLLAATSLADLAELVEPVHEANHLITDGLEALL